MIPLPAAIIFALLVVLAVVLSVMLAIASYQLLTLLLDLWYRKHGAFFAPSREKKIQQMIAFAGPLAGKRVIDLGSGDGRVVAAFARAGAAQVTGYEINPLLIFQSRLFLRALRLHNRARIASQNYWNVSLKNADVVVFFGIPWMMARLEKKLSADLRPGTLVISNLFALPTWQPKKHVGGVYLYRR